MTLITRQLRENEQSNDSFMFVGLVYLANQKWVRKYVFFQTPKIMFSLDTFHYHSILLEACFFFNIWPYLLFQLGLGCFVCYYNVSLNYSLLLLKCPSCSQKGVNFFFKTCLISFIHIKTDSDHHALFAQF